MNHDDAVGRRVYGTDHDDPYPGPRPGRIYRELLGGPLDGQVLDVTGWTAEEVASGALLITPLGVYGPGGRAAYVPVGQAPAGPWVWAGDAP
ncbi:hypothetical protein [Streptomyces sp. NPDC060333]|uniref:hypothetical protein n=1 Tax=Streptomyces sp. NPDC060333 TaxID=3347098 RepID=UPI00365F457B